MKIFKYLVVFFILLSFFVIGQEAIAQEVSSNQLYQGLGDLRKNVDQLSVANQVLALKGSKIKTSLKELQISYQGLMQENLQLEDVQSKLQKSITPKTQQIDQLNKSLSDLNSQEVAFNQQIKSLQDQISALRAQDTQLNNPSNQVTESQGDSLDNMSPQMSKILQQKHKHKLAMLKLISESQDQQALLQAKLLDNRKIIPNAGVGVRRKEALELQISQLKDEILQLNSIVNNSKPAWTEEQMRQLELSVNILENNRDELRGLLKKMQQKTQKIDQFQNKSSEQLKLESNIDELKRESKNLRIDLEEIQQQMIDLDKRKSYLEALLQ